MKNLIQYSSAIMGFLFLILTAHPAYAITSDDFNAPALNTSLWTRIDPVGDSTFALIGDGTPSALLSITVPAGTSHDVWTGGNNAPRIMQPASNTDFEVDVKFQSLMNSKYQMQGIIIEENSSNFLRFELFSNGSGTTIFAASFAGGVPTVRYNAGITTGSPLYLRVKRTGNQWKQYYSYNGTTWMAAANFSHVLNVTSVGPFIGNAGTSPPAFTGLIDYFFNTASPIIPEDEPDTSPPDITIWYGPFQKFGHIGVPQQWVNILGNVYDPSGIALLNYSLNGGSARPLSTGPDGFRLQSSGDFNIEINRADFLCRDNTVVINATDNAGNMKSKTVTIQYNCGNTWPQYYSINWSTVTGIQDAAQIVDGLWTKDTNGIHTAIPGYDRLIAIGDIAWDDYEITVPINITSPLDSSAPYGPNIGVIMRWQGHYDWDGTQPRHGWWPLGAIGTYIWARDLGDYRLRIVGNNMKLIANDTSGMHLAVGVPYIFKMRAQTVGSNTLYSLKVWEQGTTEPSNWTISGYGVTGELKKGSVLLASHYVNASFGNVTIRPGPFDDDTTPPVISNVSVEAYSNAVNVRWTTNKMTTGRVTYGLTTAYENGSVFDGTMTASHAITLTGLTPETVYHYRIISNDTGGNSVSTGDMNFTTGPAGPGITSDDFDAPLLNTSLWTWIDPNGDSTYTLTGNGTADALMSIAVPAGTPHDVWNGGNFAPRIMQSVSNTDFEIDVKFQSIMKSKYQIQGVIIQQDGDNYLRFDFVKDSTKTRIFAASFAGGIPTVRYDTGITPGNPLYLRVNRTGNQWKQYYSYDGVNWIAAGNFSYALSVTSAGPFVGNAGTSPPAFTGLIDYFFNTASPIIPEDTLALPDIITQPSNRTVIAGQSATFSVAAAGTAPLTYQWQKDGADIPGAANASYTTPIAALADNGSTFRVVVTNVNGSVTSDQAKLTVFEALPVQWWDSSRRFRIPVTVNAAGFERYEKPVEVSLNFTQMLGILGQTGTLDEDSIRVVEIDSLDAILNSTVTFQFDRDADFNAATKASGTIVFIMDGTTPANGNRYYQIYFNLTGGSYSPLPVTQQVTLTDNIMDEGQLSYRIGTADSTYYLQKQAGGFSSIVDSSGNDWINYNSKTGSAGKYRGIPNAVYPENYFHPGYTYCNSTVVSQGPIKIKVRSVSNDGKWESLWDFYPGYATMTMVKAGGSYWWLYEGTPGGVLEPNKDFMYRSDGTKTWLNQSWYGDIANNEWSYFSDPTVDRSLFVSHHEDDSLPEIYKPMEGNMTVFGFGRTDPLLIGLMNSVPQHFTIGLMKGTGFSQNSKTVYSAHKELAITRGAIEQYDSELPPTIDAQPADRTVVAGQPAGFSVSATGKLPLSYQWQKNGENISGAVDSYYNIPSANLEDNGSTFRVAVTNSMGSITSNPATLTVTSPPNQQIVLLDVLHEHNTTIYKVPPLNTDSGKAFSKFNLPSGIPGNLISPVNYAQGTLYQRLQVFSKPSTRTVKYQICMFQDQVVTEKHACSSRNLLAFTGPGTYYANQSMTSLFQYNNISWDRSLLVEMLVVADKNGVPVDDRYNYSGLWDGSPDFSLYYPMKVQYTAIIVPPGGGAPVWPQEQVSPVITTQPANQNIAAGQNARFNVVAIGKAPLSYQWQKNGVNITGANTSSYTTPPATLDDNGSTFRVLVTNANGTVTSNAATLTVSQIINLINNPGFESGTASWRFYTSGTGAFSMTSPGYEGSNAARLALSSIGTNIQLYQTDVNLEPNTRYRLSFAAYSTTGHDMKVQLIKQVSPYTNYGLDYLANLNTNWQVFSTEFSTTGFTGTVNDGRLRFWLAPYAAAGDTYYIDNVRLEKLIGSDTIPPASDLTPPTVIGNTPTGSNVPVASQITVTFSEAMNQSSAESSFSTIPAISGSFSWSGNTMTYTPDSSLTYNTTYSVTVGTGARDMASNNLPVSHEWQFTTAVLLPSVNLINNPDFESGTASWRFYTSGTGAFSMTSPGYEGSNAASLALSSIGTNIQLYQTDVNLEPNTRYRLSFAAYSTTGHDMKVQLIKQVSPYTNYGLNYLADLNTNWQVFSTEFVTTGFTGNVSDGRFRFWLAPYAGAGDMYYVDNILLEKIG